MPSKMADINDIFDDICLVEEKNYDIGYAEGISKGKEVGLIDGFQLGVSKGAEIGSEIAFYNACVHTWLQLRNKHKITNKPRLDKVLTSLQELLKNFTNVNITSDDTVQKLFEIRAKHKQVLSLLEVSQFSSGKDGSF